MKSRNGKPVGFRGSGPDHPNWRGRAVSYRTAHMRIQHLRGKASQLVCCCGEPAQEWAYDYSDPGTLIGSNGRGPLPYSPDVWRYVPMCKPCHRKFDKEHDGHQSRVWTYA